MKKFNKVYVLYANEKYFDIVSMAAKSIREFSNLPIIVYLLNSDLKVDLENTLTVKWECDLEKENEQMYLPNDPDSNFYVNRSNFKIFQILTQRPAIIKDALVNYADTVAYIDSDSVATPNIDRIFTLYPSQSPHPYFTEGIYDWMICNGRGGAASRENMSTTLEHPACELFGANQQVRDKYRTTNLFVAGQNTIEWLEEWYWMCKHPKVLKNPEWYAAFQEETLANVLLWKYKQLNGLPYVYTNGDSSVVDEVYTKHGFTGKTQSIRQWFKIPTCKENLLAFHGEKRLDEMQKMIDKIKEHNNKTKKLVYIAPHLSTGGQPQYVLKQIQEFKDQFDIYVIEYNYNSAHFIVQRNQIIDIVGSKFYSLGDDKEQLMPIINEINPDIIHLHEVPEFFMKEEIAVDLFNNPTRNYFIVTTTHSSLTTPSTLKFYPDKFVLVSEWSRQKFQEQLPEIPNDIWEYPVEKYFKDKKLAQELLGLDPEYKHVLNVGLFTPGKNQGEIFEIAKGLKDKKIKFHFVGNQAGNFQEYWEPLMKDKPENCIVWGERNDVHNFYQACDVFYFSSKFELNPLSIKEALSYEMPCLFRRLETYLDTYDNNPLVTYIDNNLERTKHLLLR